MQLSSLLFISIAAAAIMLGQAEALDQCNLYNPLRMSTQSTVVWKGYKNLKRVPASGDFSIDGHTINTRAGGFTMIVGNTPTRKNILVVVPKKGQGDDRLYEVYKNSNCDAFWDLRQDQIGAVAIINIEG
jgi:hypothetical protein